MSAYQSDIYGHESGWRWMFTPVKDSWAISHRPNGSLPWHYVNIWDSHFLDVRVIVVDLTITALLCLLLPVYFGKSSSLLQRASLLVGLTFGLFVSFGYGVATGYRTSTLMSFAMTLATLLMAAAGIAINRRSTSATE